MANVKEKLSLWWTQLQIKWYNFSFYRFKDRIAIWLSYWKVSKSVYDFDYTGVLELEQHQLKRMIKSISKYQHHVDWERDVERMQLMVNLLDIILEKTDWWSIEPKLPEDFDEWGPSHHRYIIQPYVNTRNAHKFLKYVPKEIQDWFVVDIREEKAYQIYSELRRNWLRTFWD